MIYMWMQQRYYPIGIIFHLYLSREMLEEW